MGDPRLSDQPDTLQRILDYLNNDRDAIIYNYCKCYPDADGKYVPDLLTLDPDGKPYLQEIDAVISYVIGLRDSR